MDESMISMVVISKFNSIRPSPSIQISINIYADQTGNMDESAITLIKRCVA